MYLVLIFLISTLFTISVQSDNHPTISSKLHEIIDQRCDKNAPNTIKDEEITQQLLNVNLAAKQLRATFARNNGNEFCRKKQDLAQPIYDFIQFVQPCLLEDEKYVGKLLKQHLDEILEFFCENQVANFEQTYDFKSRDCFLRMMQHSDRFQHCFIGFIDDLDEMLTKNRWCQELDELENCTIGIWHNYCPGPDYHNLHLFTQEFFDEMSEPCLAYYNPLAVNLKFLEKRCNENSNPPVSMDIIEEYMEDFIDKIEEPLDHFLSDANKFCNDKDASIESFNKLMNVVEKCLPDDEQYFDEFAQLGFDQVLNYLCKNNATNLKKIIKPEMKECFDILENSQKFETEFEHCLNDTFYLFNDITTQDELCRELNEVEDCIDDIFENYCSAEKFQALREFNDEIFDALTEECSGAIIFTNSMLVLLIVSFLSKIIA